MSRPLESSVLQTVLSAGLGADGGEAAVGIPVIRLWKRSTGLVNGCWWFGPQRGDKKEQEVALCGFATD